MPTGRTRNRTEGNWEDTGRTQTDPVEDFDEKEQRRLVTYEQEEELRPNPYNEPNQWVPIEDPPPPPVVTHRWRFDEYTGCGPNRKKVEACSNGHPRHTRRRSASELYRWDPPENDGGPTTVTTAWRDQGSPSLFGGTCKKLQRRTVTTTQKKRERNHCGGYRRADPVVIVKTEYRRVTVSETWGSWTDTGQTREHPVELIVEKEQERFSSPCNRRQTQWVVA